MKQVQINIHALEDAARLVAGDVGAKLIDATYKAIDAAEQRGHNEGYDAGAAGLAGAREVLLAMDEQVAELNEELINHRLHVYAEGRRDYGDTIEQAFNEGYDAGYPDGFQDGADTEERAAADVFECLELLGSELDGSDDLLDDAHYDIFHKRFHRPGEHE